MSTFTIYDLDPEGFQYGPEGCVCGPLYSYGGHVEPGQFDPECPYHYAPVRAPGAAGSIALIHSLVRDGWKPEHINAALAMHLRLFGMETGR